MVEIAQCPECERALIFFENVKSGQYIRCTHCGADLRMGARVVATNGLAGRVTGVMVLPDSWQLTHVRIQQRQPWGFKSFSVPATTIARLEDDAVFLDVSKADIERKQTPMRLPI